MARSPAPGRRTRPGLSRDRILTAADELLAAGRPLTMRGVAERLDVTAMALYRWFDDKDELLDALTARAAASTPAAGAEAGPWAHRALRFAVGIRRNLLAHLPLLRLEGAGRRLASTAYRDADEGLGLMLELGYRDQAAVDAYRVLFWAVLNHCLVIDAGNAMPAVVAPEGIVDRVARIEGEDLDERLPVLAAHLPLFSAVDPDAFFEQSMRTVVAGLAAHAPLPAGAGRGDR
jgi:AcrR family transcriptional regulator